MVVGVSDASEPEVTAAEAKAWGVHLTHGALYVKKKHSDKGTLGTQQLVPGIGADRKAIEGLTGDHELDETALAEAREVLADEKSDSIQRWQAATLLRIASYDESKPPLVVEVQVAVVSHEDATLDARDGFARWVVTLGAGSTRTLTLVYRIEAAAKAVLPPG
jgi:hypothetical protein